MGRVININSVGKERANLTKAIVAAMRELSKQKEPGTEVKDLISFIIISLRLISTTIEPSVVAWEKRDYWVKADRFRLEWAWTENTSIKLQNALIHEDWGELVQVVAQIGQKLVKVNISENNRLGSPWKGSWNELKKQIEDNHIEKSSITNVLITPLTKSGISTFFPTILLLMDFIDMLYFFFNGFL